jgi:hypothetical protein
MTPAGAHAPVNPQAPPYFIAIGASGSDGLDDIKALVAGLPDPLAAIVLVELHRPWDRLSHLRDDILENLHLSRVQHGGAFYQKMPSDKFTPCG